MDVSADIRFVGNGMKNILGHVFRVRRSEAHAHLRSLVSHHAQQFGKRHTALDALSGRRQSVAVHVLPQERNLLESAVAQIPNLLQYALHIAGAFPSAGVRHDAVVAEVVASAHDANESANLASADALRHDVAVGLRRREFDVHGVAAVLALGDKVG